MAERLADGSSQHGGSEGFVHERLSAIEPGLAHDRVFGITGHVQHFQRGLLCGSNRCRLVSASMPAPLSVTANITYLPGAAAWSWSADV